MLRIERILDGNGLVLRAAGRLTGLWVTELSRAIAGDASQGSIVLDLTDVSFADHNALAFLLALSTEARVVLRCNPFLSEQLAIASQGTS